MNEVTINVGATEDASKAIENIGASTKKMEKIVVDSMASTEQAFDTTARESGKLGGALDTVSGGVGQLSGGFDNLGNALNAVTDYQKASAERASEQKRKLIDVSQAMEDTQQAAEDLKQAQLDLNQSVIDGKQAQVDFEQSQIDQKQALVDAATAQQDYNTAVKEHGKNSIEAQQASIDLTQAQADLKQASLDADQAIADQAQSTEDGAQAQRDASQATIDAEGAQLDLNDAQRNAVPPSEAQGWANTLGDLAPIIMGVAGAVDLLTLANTALTGSFVKNTAAKIADTVATAAAATGAGIAAAAQWVWNIATMAFPVFLIIAAIALIVGGIIWLATKTTFFQDVWRVAWTFVKEIAISVWKDIELRAGQFWGYLTKVWDYILSIPGRIKATFSSVAESISSPFRSAFNHISSAWNSTVGRLSWTIPSWVPGIGGNSISAPRLPTAATGADILRTGAILAHKGERIVPASKAGFESTAQKSNTSHEMNFSGDTDSLIAQLIMKLIRLGYITIDETAIV